MAARDGMCFNPGAGVQNLTVCLARSSINMSCPPFLLNPNPTNVFYWRYFFPLQFLFGISGNLFNLVILNSTVARSTTAKLLSCVAVADICLFLFCFPNFLAMIPSLTVDAGFRQFFFRLGPHCAALAAWCSTASIWFTVIITIERTIAIKNPFSHIRDDRRVFLRPLFVAVFTFWLTFLFTLYGHFRFVLKWRPECTMLAYWLCERDIAKYFRLFHAIFTVFAPLVLLAVLSSILLFHLRLSGEMRRKHSSSVDALMKQERRVTTVVCVIVVAFTVFNVPSGFIHTWRLFCPRDMMLASIVSNGLVILAKDLNFVLFCLSSQNFRDQAARLLTGRHRYSNYGALNSGQQSRRTNASKRSSDSNHAVETAL